MARIWSKEFFVDSKKWAILILIAAFSFKLYLIIWQFVSNGYLVPPGGDPLGHLENIQKILAGGAIRFDFPLLYHYLMATIIQFTHLDILVAMKYSAIVLLFLPIPFFYYLSKSLFGFWAAFWATLIFILVSSNPLLGFVDGNYPDLLNYGVFVPLVFLFLVKATRGKPILYSSISLVFAILMVLTHQLTAVFTLLIIVIYLIILGVCLFLAKGREELKNFKTLAILWLVFFLILFLLIRFVSGASLATLLETTWSGNSPILSNASKPVEFSNLASLLTPMIEFLGLAGLIYIIATFRERTNEKILMVVWIVVLWVLSRTTFSALAPRYLRELSVPLSILSGVVIAGILDLVQNKFQKIIISGLVGYVIFINIVQLNTDPFILPAGFQGMVWYHQKDQEKVDYLTSAPGIPRGAIILANPSNPYLPYFLTKHRRQSLDFLIARSVPEIDESMSPKAKRKIVDDFVASFHANYIFIGSPPFASPDEKSFEEFIGYKKVTDFLSQYRFAQKNLVKEFRDGSKLIVVEK